MTMTPRMSNRLIRAIASTRLHAWAYRDDSHLLPHGIDIYIERRTAAPHGQRYAVAIDRTNPNVVECGQIAVQQHVRAFDAVLASSGVVEHAFCRAILDADDLVLGWWCETRFSPASVVL